MSDPVLFKAFAAVMTICKPLTPEQRKRILVALAFASENDLPLLIEREIASGLRTIADRWESGEYREVTDTTTTTNEAPLRNDGAVMKLRFEQRGHHVHADLFVGKRAEELALSGRLVMTEPEWQTFEAALVLGAPYVPWCHAVVLTEGWKSPP